MSVATTAPPTTTAATTTAVAASTVNVPAPSAAAAAAAAATTNPAAAAAAAASPTPAAGPAAAAAAAAAGPSHASASLYCGNLALDVSEADLFELFTQVGPVASVRVCRDANTRHSLGYAYINYVNATDAERALETLNYHVIQGKPARLMWSQRDPSLRKSGVGNIFIKNLEKNIDNKMLHDTFSAFGNILSCKVVTDENGNSRGYGYVHFESAEAADLAIETVNKKLMNDRPVYVGRHIPRRERDSKFEELKKNFTNVYLKNLADTVTEEDLTQLFQEFGEILSCAVMKDAVTGRSRGFGFINFAHHEAALQACEKLNDTDLQGKKVFVARAQKKGERQEELTRLFEARKMERLNKYQGVNLYIKNLDDAVDDEKLRDHFASYGTITSAKIARDERGNSKGFGFVCFSSSEEATRAVTGANGEMFGSKPIYVALAQRREFRRHQLELQYAQRAQIRAQTAGGMVAPGSQFYPPQMMYNPMMNAPTATRYMNMGMNMNMLPQPQLLRSRFPQHARPFPPMGPPGGGYGAPAGMGMHPQQGRNPRLGGGGGPPPGSRPRTTGGLPGVGGRPPMGPGPNGLPPNAAVMGAGPRRPYGGKFPSQPQMRGNPVMLPGAGGIGGPSPVPVAMYGDQQQMSLNALTNALANAPPEQQKSMLGERLYPLVLQMRGEAAAGKLTGILLDMDNAEVIMLLENPETLSAKIQEVEEVMANQGTAVNGDAGK